MGVETVVTTLTLLLVSICSMLMGRMEETTSPGLTSTNVKLWDVPSTTAVSVMVASVSVPVFCAETTSGTVVSVAFAVSRKCPAAAASMIPGVLASAARE